ncbi:hypothetical protein OG625_09010 [Streptomyces sp. NBC_01351]|uniref:Ig-like domain-containing protein n=1 Tax=Streptomyces sp. NBC_01351 TaxID=2903833 RepID=UPI002E31878B|nr:Ig-like domain-containing protein [Streptomyces sp. NBC_01351]
MTYLLTTVRIQEPGVPGNTARVTLQSEAHPRASVAPGQTVRLALTVQAGPAAWHAYGYLAEDSVADAAEVLGVSGAEYSPAQRRYRVRAQAGASETAVLTLRVRPETTAPALRPEIGAAIPGQEPRKLLRVAPLAHEGVRIRGLFAPGHALNIPPHQAHVPAVIEVRQGLPQGTVLIGHGQPSAGTVSVTGEGALAFQAAPGAMGYDHFPYTVRSASGEQAEGRVVVYIGDLSATPGLLTPPGFNGVGTTRHLPWAQPTVHGPLPWPEAPVVR